MKVFKVLLWHYLLLALIFFVGRAGLLIVYYDRVVQSGVNHWLSFLYGLRMDTILISMLLVVPLLVLTLTPARYAKTAEKGLKAYFTGVFTLAIFVEIATFPFFAEYDVRPNYKFVEYLAYPKEVFGMLLADYKLAIALAVGAIWLFLRYYRKAVQERFAQALAQPLPKRALLTLPLALLLFIGIRSSFSHRPANISDALYSSSRLVNEITKNSIYSVLYAVYASGGSQAKRYGKMPAKEALTRVCRRLNITGNDLSGPSPLSRLEPTHFQTKRPKNLVIFLQESLGYQFVTPHVTPNLWRLKNEGIWLDNLYANSTRSIRGIAGTVSGIYSVPGKGVVKRSKSQSDFFTFAKLLKPLGYETLFIYGGNARFDNMRAWFLGNGFDRVIEQKDYKNPAFTANWGVSDEDLVNKALETFDSLAQKGKPFGAVMFSSSNHTPFDYPEGRVTPLPGEPIHGVKNAVKYADYAIGRFINEAKKRPWWQDTVIVIVADHNVRTWGNEIVPVRLFHIPGLILGGGIKPRVYDKLAGQPDLLATALDLLGKDFTYPIMGHSIFSDKKRPVNLYKFNDTFALRDHDKIAIIRPGKKAQTFTFDGQTLHPAPHDERLEKDLLAFIVTLDYLYNKRAYR
ncbi:MAG: sulfatase-like hydrolase/transferase [Epsilonproteobacteria bacterium]|nr:sulfatase-like hydrolase/transferase [Campylobacterota bacterium]